MKDTTYFWRPLLAASMIIIVLIGGLAAPTAQSQYWRAHYICFFDISWICAVSRHH